MEFHRAGQVITVQAVIGGKVGYDEKYDVVVVLVVVRVVVLIVVVVVVDSYYHIIITIAIIIIIIIIITFNSFLTVSLTVPGVHSHQPVFSPSSPGLRT